MHSITLNIDDSIFDKFMGLLELLPQEKITVHNEDLKNTVTFPEAQSKVNKALNNMSSSHGISLEDAFKEVLNS